MKHSIDRRLIRTGSKASSWYLVGILLVIALLTIARTGEGRTPDISRGERAPAAPPHPQAPSGVGNGDSYDGGDTEDRRLASARDALVRSLSFIRYGYDVGSLCDPDACQAAEDTDLCATLRTLSKPQREECVRYITETSDEMLRLNTRNPTPFKLSSTTLQVPDPFGVPRPVAAMTKVGNEGPIIFNHATLKTLSPDGLVALLGHELGHKAAAKGRPFVQDNVAVGHFKYGREFLDAVGAAIGVYAANHDDPIQPPPALALQLLPKDRPLCSLASDKDAGFLLGLALDTQRLSLSADKLQGWKARLSSHAGPNSRFLFVQGVLADKETHIETLRHLFSRFLRREPSAAETGELLKRLPADGAYDGIIASLLSDPLYQWGKSTSDGQFLHDVYMDLLGRAPSQSEMAAQAKLTRPEDKAAFVRRLLKENEDAQSSLIGWWYQAYLDRLPTITETQFQLSRLKAGIRWQTLQALVLSSDEYAAVQRNRFFPAGDKYECGVKDKVAVR